MPCSELSNTHGPVNEQFVRIVHPFHPLRGRLLPLVTRKWLWGEERVTVELSDMTYRSIPVAWTDAAPVDPHISVGGGRSLFRVEDLMELACMIKGSEE